MTRISWIKNESTFIRMEGGIQNIERVPVGIYEVEFSPLSGWSLTRTGDKFTFDYKLYNLQNEFVDYVVDSYNATSGNLGLLFTGVQGSGKTATAKVLANTFNLPIILVKSMGDNNSSLLSYLASFNFDCVYFFDEFEKQFNEKDPFILQLMDGVYNSEFRRIFLLTTNDLTVNRNLLSRPSRIRYVREFGNLPKDVVNEYLMNNLVDKSNLSDLLNYIDTLTIATIDIVKTITEEVNIHGVEKFLENKKSFNVQLAKYHYSVLIVDCYENDVTSGKFKLADFEEYIKLYQNQTEINDSFKERLKACSTDEEKQAIIDEKEEFNDKVDEVRRDRVDSEVMWARLKIGDSFYYGKVVKVVPSSDIVVTKDGRWYYFYKILNPNEKPSLYSPVEISYPIL